MSIVNNSRKNALLSFLVANLMLTVSAVQAAEIQSDSQSYLAEWGGLYIGGSLGFGWGEFKQGEYDSVPDGTSFEDMDGMVAGATLGYNFQMDRVVLGLEADIQATSIFGTLPLSSVSAGKVWVCNGGVPCKNEINWFASMRGRFGYAFGNNLPYLTAGVVYANVRSKDKRDETFAGTIMDKGDWGYTVGGGFERILSEHLTAKIEALYVDLGKTDSNQATTFFADNHFGVVRAGLNWKF